MTIDFAPAWRRHVRTHARSAIRPIAATVTRETPKAILIRTATREAWIPKRLVTEHDPATGVFHLPNWFAEQKLLS